MSWQTHSRRLRFSHDVRNSEGRQIEEQETDGESAFDGRTGLGYRQVLGNTRFAGDEHARWLLST